MVKTFGRLWKTNPILSSPGLFPGLQKVFCFVELFRDSCQVSTLADLLNSQHPFPFHKWNTCESVWLVSFHFHANFWHWFFFYSLREHILSGKCLRLRNVYLRPFSTHGLLSYRKFLNCIELKQRRPEENEKKTQLSGSSKTFKLDLENL